MSNPEYKSGQTRTLGVVDVYLADTLKYLDNFLEIADMEDWEDKVDMAKVTITGFQTLAAGGTNVLFA